MTFERLSSLTKVFVFVTVVWLGAAATEAAAGCGDFNADGTVSALDSLGVLQAAVGTGSCDLVRCDVDGGGAVGATDALIVLQSAIGHPVPLSCPGVAISQIDQLPRATGPVSGGAQLSALVSAVAAGGAETGINLRSLDAATFDANSSMAACEVSNLTRSAVNEASEADLILCYVQTVFPTVDDGTIDIYDGQFHTFGLDFGTPPPGVDPDELEGPSRVKMRLVRQGATIVDFEMFTCSDTPEGEVQDGYVRQTIDGPDFSMVSIGFHDNDSGGSAYDVSVTGSLNDAGQFVGTKLIQNRYDDNWEEGSGYGEMELAQGASSFVLDGFDSGSHSYGGSAGIYGRQIHSQAELIDLNTGDGPYDLSLLSIGHGAAKARSTGSDNWGDWDHLILEGWNGDTTQVDANAAASFLDLVETVDLVAVGERPVIELAPEQVYDCADAIEAVVPVDQPTLDAECSALELGWDYVNCWEIIQPGDECDGGECGEPCEGPDCGPCEGPDCGPCEGPDCYDECWDPSCECDPEMPECFDACWDPACEPPF